MGFLYRKIDLVYLEDILNYTRWVQSAKAEAFIKA